MTDLESFLSLEGMDSLSIDLLKLFILVYVESVSQLAESGVDLQTYIWKLIYVIVETSAKRL